MIPLKSLLVSTNYKLLSRLDWNSWILFYE